jgi:hypothetical protein
VPKFRKLISAFAAATVMVAVVAGSVFSAAPAGAVELDPSAIEQDFVARINGLRASQGLGQLSSDSAQLTSVARQWSESMAAAGGISHRPNLADVAPSNWIKLGENVGVGPDTETLHNAFVASPGHYKNLVDPGFTIVAVGVVVRDGRIFVTENFMTASGVVASSAPASTPAASSAPAASGAAPAAAAASADSRPATAAKAARACKARKCRTVKVRKARKAVKRVAAVKRSTRRR